MTALKTLYGIIFVLIWAVVGYIREVTGFGGGIGKRLNVRPVT